MHFSAKQVIAASVYGEFPDAVVTLKLARRQAELEGRDTDQALRNCAGVMANRIKLNALKYALLDMVLTQYPTNSLVGIENQSKKMVRTFLKTYDTGVEAESFEALKRQLAKPVLPYR